MSSYPTVKIKARATWEEWTSGYNKRRRQRTTTVHVRNLTDEQTPVIAKTNYGRTWRIDPDGGFLESSHFVSLDEGLDNLRIERDVYNGDDTRFLREVEEIAIVDGKGYKHLDDLPVLSITMEQVAISSAPLVVKRTPGNDVENLAEITLPLGNLEQARAIAKILQQRDYIRPELEVTDLAPKDETEMDLEKMAAQVRAAYDLQVACENISLGEPLRADKIDEMRKALAAYDALTQ